MLDEIMINARQVFERGGWVMWPLLLLSFVAVMLIVERCWFWLRQNHPGRKAKLRRACEHLQRGELEAVQVLLADDRSVYGRIGKLLTRRAPTEATISQALQSQQPRLDRFMPTLGTIITAAPLLGILGTVTGIIASFRILGGGQTITDPDQVGAGIAEALLTTVFGLVIALVVLFPFNAFRAQIDRTMGRIEMLIAAAEEAWSGKSEKPAGQDWCDAEETNKATDSSAA